MAVRILGFSKIAQSRPALYGTIMSLSMVVLCLMGPILAPYESSEFSNDLLSPPSSDHYLGTDQYGQDLFSRILRGGRITLFLAIATVCLAGMCGTVWGLMAAYTRGAVSILLNRSIDIAMSFPSIMTALFVLAVVGTGSTGALILAIAITYAPRFARVICGSTLPILEEDFILAVKALGAGHLRILMINVLPNLIAHITVLTSIYLPDAILLESALSFLGLGAPPDVPTWGRIISDGKAYMQSASWLTIFPGITIVFTALSFNLLGDGLRDILDPRSASRLHT